MKNIELKFKVVSISAEYVMILRKNPLTGTDFVIPVQDHCTGNMVKQSYRFLPVYHGKNCPPYLCPGGDSNSAQIESMPFHVGD